MLIANKLELNKWCGVVLKKIPSLMDLTKVQLLSIHKLISMQALFIAFGNLSNWKLQ